MLYTCPAYLINVTRLWNAELVEMIEIIFFPPKQFSIVAQKLEFQTISIKGADKSYYRLRWHTVSILFHTNLSPWCASTSAHVSTKSWIGAMRAYRIHRRATVKQFSLAKNKSNFWLWEIGQLQLKTTFFQKTTSWVFKIQWLPFTGEVDNSILCINFFSNRFIFERDFQEKIFFSHTVHKPTALYCSMAWYVCCSVWISWLSRGQWSTWTRLHSGQMSTYQTDDPHFKCLHSIHRRPVDMLWSKSSPMQEVY